MTDKHPASITDAIEYITNKLTTDKLIMAEAVEHLNWTFPRIRSRARTICKRLNGVFRAESRGVYIFEPRSVRVSQSSEERISNG